MRTAKGHTVKRLLYWLIVFPLLASILLPATPVRAQGTEILKPTAHTISGTGTIENPEYAYDKTTAGDNTTYNRLGVGDNNDDPTIEYHTWQTPICFHTERRLYIRRSGTGNTGAKPDTWGIYYSTDNGSNYTPIETGLLNPSENNTAAVTIGIGLDLSNLWVKISTFKDAGDDGGSAYIYDVWLEGDYTPLPDISNTPDDYAFGVVSEGSTSSETGLDYFTVTNNGTCSVTITIGGTDMIGDFPWTLDNDGNPGPGIYGLWAGLEGASYNVTVKKDSPYNTLVSNLAASANQSWGLKLYAPTEFSGGGEVSGNVTLTIAQA